MLDKTDKFIQKIIDGTLIKEYIWKSNNSPLKEIRENLPIKEMSNLIFSEYYYFENDTNLIALLQFASNINPYSLFVYSFKSKNFSIIQIDTQTYFRLQTVIKNQQRSNNDLLDEFLNS